MAARIATNTTVSSARTALIHCSGALQYASPSRFASCRPGRVLKQFAPPRTQAAYIGRPALQCMAMASNGENAVFEVYCKGAPEGGNPSTKGTTLDCPFSQRVMMTLGEKDVKFVKQLCDEQDLPKFLGDHHPAGKPLIPVVKDLQKDKWLGESDDIVTYIEEKYPDPKLGTPATCSKAGEGIFPDTFLEFLLAEGEDEAEAKKKLEAKYQELDEAFGKNGGPYLSGKEPCARCIALGPQLYHINIATGRIKGWAIPDKYSNIHSFLAAIKARPSWGPSAPVNDDVVEDGWRTKIKSKKES